MSNHLKKQRFSLGVPRLFTRGSLDASEMIHFYEPELMGDEASSALTCPDNWSLEAAELVAEQAALKSVPKERRATEENTVPSWLWRHVAEGKGKEAESSAQQIFDRVIGSATYTGWKQGLFSDETEAQNFYEEARYALLQRFIALEPRVLAPLGLEWAYGSKAKAPQSKPTKAAAVIEISNLTIDAVVGGSLDKQTRGKWQKLLGSKKSAPHVDVHFSDISSDWNVGTTEGTVTTLDLLALRHNDGSVNIEALRHTTRLAAMLLDLQGFAAFSIGFTNLAPLLTALAIPYDSDTGRTMAAAIAAIITAEAYATSAELAALRGVSGDYKTNRERVLRTLRNHRRATYGDRNDYEKISVLPVPLGLDKCPDLTLAAAAQRRWDEALELVREHGLRATQVTALGSSPTLALFMESTSQGIEPMQTLTVLHDFQRETASHVTEALARLGYDRAAIKAIVSYIAGTRTLEKAPIINHTSLRAHGLDHEAIERIEAYLPQVNDIRLAFTPWVIGVDFCRKVLKIPATKLQNPAFNLLNHLGFDAAATQAANAYCYGHDTAKDAKDLRPKHTAIFARGDEIPAEARIKMAAAVQGFVSGGVGLDLPLPASMPKEKSEKLLLGAWQQGVKSLSLSFDERIEAHTEDAAEKRTGTRVATFLHTRKPSLPTRLSRPKASRRLVSQQTGAGKAGTKGRNR